MKIHELNKGTDSKNEQIITPILGCSHMQPYRVGVDPLMMDIHNDWITNIEYNEDCRVW